MVTVQCTGRTFRLLPTPKVAATILYCFFASLVGFNIEVHDFCFLSNHFHIVMTPREANLPDFMQKFNSILSRALNALRGVKGSNIEDHYNITLELDPEAIYRQCAYTLANPCAAHLVSKIKQWRGPNSFGLEYGEAVVVERPKFGIWTPPEVDATKKRRRRKHPWEKRRRSFRGRWTLPAKVSFALKRPPVDLGVRSDAQVRERIRTLALQRQKAAEVERKKNRRRALGMRRVLKQDWWDMPRSKQDLFGAEPKFAASSRWARREAAQRDRTFQADYREAWLEWKAGRRDVKFPAGTFWMRRRFDVCCAPAPPG